MSVWYIGDPCYAIEDERWQEFVETAHAKEKELKREGYGDSDPFEGDGLSFNWEWIDEDGDERTNRVYVYNSGLGGDGSVHIQGGLCVDAGWLSVMPIGLCKGLIGTSVGNHGCHAVVDSQFRPVFDIDTHNHPHIRLTIDGEIEDDNYGYRECDECGEWKLDAEIIWSNTQGAVGDCCYLGEEE
jgi:hypothetical protein